MDERWFFLSLYMHFFVNLNPLMWAYMSCFFILGIKRIQETKSWISWPKPGKYWKLEKIRDQGLNFGRILKKIYERCKFLKILVSFNGFWPLLKEGSKKKEFGHFEEFSDFGRFDLLSLIGLYHNIRGRIWRSWLMKIVDDLKSLDFI